MPRLEANAGLAWFDGNALRPIAADYSTVLLLVSGCQMHHCLERLPLWDPGGPAYSGTVTGRTNTQRSGDSLPA